MDLVLYISRRSPASLKARRRMDEVLAEFDAGPVRFEVCDLFENAASAERDLLTMCGVARREARSAT